MLTTRPVLLALGVTTGLVAGIGLWFLLRRDVDSGPLATIESGISVSQAADIGESFTYGEVTVVAPQGGVITLKDVKLVPITRTPGVTVLAVLAAEPSRGDVVVSTGTGFPPTDLVGKTRAVNGAKVPTPGQPNWDRGVEVVFHLVATRIGRWDYAGVRFTFDKDGKPGSQFVAAPFSLCTPSTVQCDTQPPVPTG